jgi:pimeloyl-ACP methyl ester carboxylesterase
MRNNGKTMVVRLALMLGTAVGARAAEPATRPPGEAERAHRLQGPEAELQALDDTLDDGQRRFAAPGNMTVVLVHGAFADGSSWDKVIPLLQAKGLKVVAVQNPLTSLADDVAATKRVIDAQSGPVVLVGHSWGGTVITQAGGDDKVAALVFVAAISGRTAHLLPAQGASTPTRRATST